MTLDSASNRQLDNYDKKIIRHLVEDGRMPVTTLSSLVGLSKTPCQKRLNRLIAEGYITGFRAMVDPKKLDIEHIAFTEVKLTDTREQALRTFNAAVARIAEIEQCHMIAGPFDYLLKVRTRNIDAYRRALGERISTLPFVASTSTYVSMETVKDVQVQI